MADCQSAGRSGKYIINITRIVDHDATEALRLSDAERIGRQQCVELDQFLRERVLGFGQALLEFAGPSVGGGAAMITDIGNTKINGVESNLALHPDSIPVRGEISG